MIDFAVYSDSGSREVNEDYFSVYSDKNKFCFVLADGLGGEGSGDMASRFVCNHTVTLAEKAEKLDSIFLDACFPRIQKNLLRAKAELFITDGMTSTLSILTINNNNVSWGHIGDTRIYMFKSGVMKSVTADHSLAQFMISSGMSDIKDLRQHPDRSTLMAAMGMGGDMRNAYEIDAENVALNEPTEFLMCTDGFWQYVDEPKMEEIISAGQSAEKTIAKFVKTAKKNANKDDRDNMSAIFIKFIPDEENK